MDGDLLRIRSAINTLQEHFAQEDDNFLGSVMIREWLHDMVMGFEELIDSAGLYEDYMQEQELMLDAQQQEDEHGYNADIAQAVERHGR